jgi:hypothetical protein
VDNRILFEFSPWFVLLCILAGLVYAFLLYNRKNPWGKIPSIVLAGIRFLTVSLIAFLLLGPLIRHIQNTIIEPNYVVAVDNSLSIPETYAEQDFNRLINDLDQTISALPAKNQNLKIVDLAGNDYSSVKDIEFDETATDLNKVLHKIENEYEGKNLAGVILISDGIYNLGSSPIYSNFGFPVYSIGIGDTTEKEDIILKYLNHNKIVYQGNKFVLQAEIYNKGYRGNTISVDIRKKGIILQSKILQINTDNGLNILEFELEAEESGMQRYEVIINPLSSEFSTENNRLDAFIEVVEGKEKILVLASAPHPDLKALKSIIEKNDNYEIETIIPGFNNKNEEKFDLVILHQLPDNRNNYSAEIEEIINKGTPVLFILGSRTNFNRFNATNRTMSIKPLRNQRDNVFVSLNSNFSLFSLDESFKNIYSDLPPIPVPFGEYSLKGESEIVLYQRIGKIISQKPLLIINKNPNVKEALLAGEGIWKWRLNEYLFTKEFAGVDNLFNKIVQYLSAKEDRRKFRVYPLRTENWDNEPVIFETEIYNDIYEKIYDQKIDLRLSDEENNQYDYSYIISQANSQFKISGLKPGVYSYSAKTLQDGKTTNIGGMFAIKKLLVEISNLKADFNLLSELSRRSSGKSYTKTDMNVLSQDIESSNARSLIYSSENYLAIINLKWIFFLILFLISLEWGIRKYLGGY